MVDENTLLDITTGEIEKDIKQSKRNSQNITINDATSETAKTLVKEWGSDVEYKKDGKVDIRRHSNISSLDVMWLMYFSNLPDKIGGKYTKAICEEFLNLRDSVNAQHKKLQIGFIGALTGRNNEDKEENKRGIIQRITGRGNNDE